MLDVIESSLKNIEIPIWQDHTGHNTLSEKSRS